MLGVLHQYGNTWRFTRFEQELSEFDAGAARWKLPTLPLSYSLIFFVNVKYKLNYVIMTLKWPKLPVFDIFEHYLTFENYTNILEFSQV